MPEAHRKNNQQICRNCTKKFNKDCSGLDLLESNAAANDSIAIPVQELFDAKTKHVLMMVQLANGLVISNRTSEFLRAPSWSNKCICVFNVFDANCIKRVVIKSRHWA